ncbi:MAG: tRNA (adenosine(37)-N6)-dimethylallyltransferase MiaA [Chitinophagaceae bacterium]|nr:tRNA (adenosine(37)-N6)-dimethylallyltransferase MiaA [Chitinophagaceae bacterium]MBK8952166.1 tRNA (adenosine(37)-N6)-dimethylallyltransferase MiaA [Chitinophagaceae bacterium]
MPSNTVIVIAGPTASGKTTFAIQIAKYFSSEIISTDSRQCYKELNIGVARPSAVELNEVPHHFIASHSIADEVTAASFARYALQKVNELFAKNNIVVMVGGTGLYIKAFCEGLDTIPSIDKIIREQIADGYNKHGLEWLQEQLKQKDAAFYAEGEIHNPQRLMRALEVVEGTGRSVLSFRTGKKQNRDFNIIKLGIQLTKEELHSRIIERVDKMMEAGLLDEVKSLVAYKELNALQTVGYAELFDHLEGKTSLVEAVELIKVHTRQYAKRQLTWFKKDSGIKWVDAGRGFEAGITDSLLSSIK